MAERMDWVSSHEEADRRLAALLKEQEAEEATKRAGEVAPGGLGGPERAGECAVCPLSVDQPQGGPAGEASGDASQIGAGVTQAGAPTAPGWTEASDELKDLHPTGLEEHLWPAMPRPGARWLANYHQAEQQRALLPESTP